MTAFASARDLLRWAREEVQKFDSVAEGFVSGNPYSQVREIDPQAGQLVLKLRVAPVPDELRKLASHALWDLKHALDHATCAAILTVTGRAADDVHFPWSSHPRDLEFKLSHVSKRYPDGKYPAVLRDVFRGFEPYPSGDGYAGGSDELCLFSKMCNTTKHAVALSAVARSHMAGFRTIDPMIRMFVDNWDSATQELAIGEFPLGANSKVQLQVATHIGFSDVPAFEGHPVSEVISVIADAVETMINDLEAAAAKPRRGG
jgi:hypothetical protein